MVPPPAATESPRNPETHMLGPHSDPLNQNLSGIMFQLLRAALMHTDV